MTASDQPRARALALHLPQFHPIPENDEWWEPGFTEWTNVARAKPRFPGHYQPHLPADLGFYDLRLVESLRAQADLAARYGLEGFIFWHYWFAGRRILERPLELWRGPDGPEFGFALAWANQTWSGHWHGTEKRVLIEQTYPTGDDEAHFASLLPSFTDPRYITIDGKPLFYLFRGEDLPEPKRFVDRWQSLAQGAGLPGLFLVAEVNDPLGRSTYDDPIADGFDAGIDLQLPARRTTFTTVVDASAPAARAPGDLPVCRAPDQTVAARPTATDLSGGRPRLGQLPPQRVERARSARQLTRALPCARARRHRSSRNVSAATSTPHREVMERVG